MSELPSDPKDQQVTGRDESADSKSRAGRSQTAAAGQAFLSAVGNDVRRAFTRFRASRANVSEGRREARSRRRL